MSLVEIVEGSPRGRKWALGVVAAMFAAAVIVELVRFSGGSVFGWRDRLSDFDDFRIVASMIDHGLVRNTYHLRDLVDYQLAHFPDFYPMPWTYPPQYDLLVWALARLAKAPAYLLFLAATFAGYGYTIHRLAPGRFATLCILLAPSLVMLLRCGQNGFLTGALIGGTAIGLVEGRAWAGGPLGLMAIKPHLAVAMAFHMVFARGWKALGLAALVTAASSALATAVYGVSIWSAFLGGAREAGIFLAASDYYPFYRMISIYALGRSLGLDPGLSAAAQGLCACGVILAVRAAWERFTLPQAVGVAAIGSVMVSPYAYDYDLPVLGVGLALLLGDLQRYSSPFERGALYAAMIGLQTAAFAAAVFADFFSSGVKPVAFAPFVPIVVLAVCWRALERARADAVATVCVAAPWENCPA